ncbi:MAG: hypothetical protein KKH52_03040, partial [Nanoarchaeota archaeon]|nr:hypothetical protein [Nanoarchaeota archaeon]
MNKLIEMFKDLPLPDKDNNIEFSAVSIEKNQKHKIGKDVNGCPTLLIAIGESKSQSLLPNVNLRNIKVFHDLECKIKLDNKLEEGKFTIVTFSGTDVGLYDSFLRFCEVLLESIKDRLDRDSVAKVLDRCVKLFKDI